MTAAELAVVDLAVEHAARDYRAGRYEPHYDDGEDESDTTLIIRLARCDGDAIQLVAQHPPARGRPMRPLAHVTRGHPMTRTRPTINERGYDDTISAAEHAARNRAARADRRAREADMAEAHAEGMHDEPREGCPECAS